MQIIHRVSINDAPNRRAELRSLGVDFLEPSSPLIPMIWFDVAENHPSWREVEVRIREWGASDIVRTKFNTKEVRGAQLLELNPTWHHGYPQPADDFGYLSITYDLSMYCSKCGIGKRQIAPFHLKGEPNWGKNHFLQLNWVFDEFFVSREIWQSVLRAMKIDYMPVIDHETGRELDSIVQIDMTHVPRACINTNGLSYEDCRQCGRRKYLPVSRGFFPEIIDPSLGHLFKSHEEFGSGASAWSAVLVSAEFFHQVQNLKLKGVSFVPTRGKTE